MRGATRGLWKAGIAIAGMLLLLLLLAWIPVSTVAASVQASNPDATATVTVRATPTVDATVTALNKALLTLQVKQLQNQLQNQNNWFFSNSNAFIAALTAIIIALFGIYQWAGNRRDQCRFIEARSGVVKEERNIPSSSVEMPQKHPLISFICSRSPIQRHRAAHRPGAAWYRLSSSAHQA